MTSNAIQASNAAPRHGTKAYAQKVAPGYRRTEIGVIPEDWSIYPLFELAGENKSRFDDGDWVEAEFLTESGVRLLQTGNIGVGEFVDKESRKYISDHSFDFLRCKEVHPGDLLICRLADPAGRACIVPDLGERRMITSVDVTIFRPVPELASSRFLLHVFGTRKWFTDVSDRCGGSTRSRIARGQLAKIKVQTPTVREQCAIAEALSDVDGLLAALKALIAKKRAIKQAAMQQLLTGKTRLPGFSGEWETKRLGEVAAIESGATPSTQVPAYWDGDIPWCTPTDITGTPGKYLVSTERRITRQGLESCAANLLPRGALLLCSRATVGELKIATTPVCTNQGFKSLVCKPGTSHEFLYYLLLTLKPELIERSSGSTFLEIGKRDVASVKALLPTEEEQIAIATVLSDMDADIAALETRCNKTRQIKQGMMLQLLTGRVRLVQIKGPSGSESSDHTGKSAKGCAP